MASRRFEPGALRGTLAAPPDKSISHRAALLAAMGERTVSISRYLGAADTLSTLRAAEALGAVVETAAEEGDGRNALEVRVSGVGLRGPLAGIAVDVGNAGTLMRLLCGWLAAQPDAAFELDGDSSIRSRPMERVAGPLRLMGAGIETAGGGRPPLRIAGARLHGINHRMPVASAQVKSALLLAGLLAEGSTTVHEPEPTRDHTERMLTAAGVAVASRPRSGLPTGPSPAVLGIEGPVDGLELPDLSVPGDLSSAAFHIVGALVIPGSEVRIEGVGLNPTRIGLLGILNRMGAQVEVEELGFEAGEPVGAIAARHGELSATRVGGAEVPLAIDELPLLALAAAFAEGETVLSGAAELRHKESDRIAGVVEGLGALGAEIEAREDGFAVRGGGGLRGGRLEARGDHRLAMLGAIAGRASREGTEVAGIEAAAVSYPGFERDLAGLGG